MCPHAANRELVFRVRSEPHGSTSATYVIHNDATDEVEIKEVTYDVGRTCQAIVEAGLPPVFAWRLSHGFEYAEQAEDASHVCER